MKNMKNMKKWFVAFLALALLCGLFVGCGNEDFPQQKKDDSGDKEANIPTLRILVDLSIGGDTYEMCQEIKRFLQSHAEGCGEDYQVEVEALPTISEPDKRNPVLTGLHMEMQSGSPDLFIIRNYSDGFGRFTDLKNFFPYPTSAMRQRLFLPLDSYIADDPEWENLRPAVMEAGKLNGSQQLVPLSYTFSVSLVDKEQYTPTEELPMTAKRMMESSDTVLRWAACNGVDMLGVLADYQEEELSFTEEELLAFVKQMKASRETKGDLELNQEKQSAIFDISAGPMNDSFFRADENENYWMIPAYNQEGGVTAQVRVFAAINQGTRYPDEAYAVLKALFSKEAQQAGVATCLYLPVYMGLGREDAPVNQDWYLDDWDYRQLEGLQEQINAVEFVTPLTGELEGLFLETAQMEDDGQMEKAVHDAYTRMRMMLAES